MSGTFYSVADDATLILLAEVKRKWHRSLHDADVRVGVLFAANENGDPIKAGGYPALAQIKIVSLKDRLTKEFDAELLIDLAEWDDLSHAEREALIDHELTHLVLAESSYRQERDANGHTIPDPVTGEPKEVIQFKVDDLNRPKLKIRKGDFNLGDGFDSVIKRHRTSALEFIHLRKLHSRAERLYDESLEEELKGYPKPERPPQPTIFSGEPEESAVA
jgi:hypothetical protein